MEAWLERTGHERGAVLTFEQMWALAQKWYRGRCSPQWRGRSLDQARAILGSVGLTDEFWRLD